MLRTLRRALVALSIAGLTAAALRLRGSGGVPPQQGGWRELDVRPPRVSTAAVSPSSVPIVGVLGTGVVGARVVRQLASSAAARSAVYDTRRSAAVAVARANRDAVAVDGQHDLGAADVVVLATPTPQFEAARAFLGRGRAVVATTDDLDDVHELIGLGPLAYAQGAALVVGAAMSPGLTGLLARHLADRLDRVTEIHVAVHGTGGPACARRHHRALSGRNVGWHDGEWIDRQGGTGRELCWFPDPVGALDCYRAELADPILLHAAFPGVERISARRAATRRDRLTAALPMLSPPHREGGVGALRVEVRGCAASGARETYVVGVADRAASVAATVAGCAALHAAQGRFPRGLTVLGRDSATSAPLLADVAARGVRLREFVGAAP